MRYVPRDQNGVRVYPNDLVKVDFSQLSARDRRKYPFRHGEILLYLGEVRRMRGPCIVVNKQGQTFWGYHTDHFVRLTNDEV